MVGIAYNTVPISNQTNQRASISFYNPKPKLVFRKLTNQNLKISICGKNCEWFCLFLNSTGVWEQRRRRSVLSLESHGKKEKLKLKMKKKVHGRAVRRTRKRTMISKLSKKKKKKVYRKKKSTAASSEADDQRRAVRQMIGSERRRTKENEEGKRRPDE
ncbi:hypothetical protein Ddye_016729 [Dipteronia dyeriana]|uniref:Uncharacterized protein n=1 Tax=Dipteronia dyeriana TaxID=168575 RepID=A0AAD9U874_9ROSI|nr:hypothetical protein Ddye_016729 [Dipteronia dyeriana]